MEGAATRQQLIEAGRLRLDLLERLAEPPPLFAPGERLFWADPHIARQLLAVHLDPDVELASRRPEAIDRTVRWLLATLDLPPGGAVLDLGCGPGLYAERLARRGLAVTGIDISAGSIAYAAQQAGEAGLAIEYRVADYLALDAVAAYDAVLLIYGDLCPLAPERRDALLRRVHRALRPGGRFVFDVSTRRLRARVGAADGWAVAPSGFWKPGPHLVLTRGFDYPEADTFLDQYVVIEADGTVSVYRNWFLDYSLETITAALDAQGFAVESAWADLEGTPYDPDADWIGIVAVPSGAGNRHGPLDFGGLLR